MNPKTRNIEIPERPVPVALPLKLGMADGSNANLVTDANNDVIGQSYAIVPKLSVDEARKSEQMAPRIEQVEYMLNAVNSYETLVGALRLIYAVAPNRRTAQLAEQALKAAKELKE